MCEQRRTAAVIRGALLAAQLALLVACVRIPAGIQPVRPFESERYLGTWYEIARLENRFERGLSNVTARYDMNADGSIRVVNRGYSDRDETWKQVTGRAKFARGKDEGYLGVSFFGPFHAAYVIFELDAEGYSYAFVTGMNRSYLWLLARTPTVDESLVSAFRARSRELGFELDDLVIVDQSHYAGGAPAGVD